MKITATFREVPLSIKIIAGFYLCMGLWGIRGIFRVLHTPHNFVFGWEIPMYLFLIIVPGYLCLGLLRLRERARQIAIVCHSVVISLCFVFFGPYLIALVLALLMPEKYGSSEGA